MAGTDLAFTTGTAPRAGGMDRLERVLAGHNIRLAPGVSRCTGQAVVRIVDATTGRSGIRLPHGLGEELSVLADELAAARHPARIG